MAGLYPDPTSWRMALDRDGSVVVAYTNWNKVIVATPTQMAALNDESSGTNVSPNGMGMTGGEGYLAIGVIFPELRDIDAFLLSGGNGHTAVVEVSTNTTNMQDGTWTQIVAVYNHPSVAGWRTQPQAQTALAVKAIRWRSNNSGLTYHHLHLYGETAPNENPDRLVFWDALMDTKMAPATLDFGDVPRSSSADRIVRVKNLSQTLTAYDIRVSFDIKTDATGGAPSVPAQHTVSYLGGAFLAQVNIGSLGPETISGPITLRRVTPSNAQLGLFAPRVSAVADSYEI